jgi:hypothetical protein
MKMRKATLEEMVAYCNWYGFIFQGSENIWGLGKYLGLWSFGYETKK